MADVVKPELVWIEGRCYRINEPTADLSQFQEHDMYENETTYQDVEDDGGDDDFEILELDNGKFGTKFHVAQYYLGSVIGKRALVKRKIECETRTEIRIPKQGEDGDIVILGPSAANVKAARRRINVIVIARRFKERPTHFISIPLNSPGITASFNQFKEEILKEQCDRGLDEKMFIQPCKLHLTLCVMCLMDSHERLVASKLLTEARDKIILPSLRNEPLRMRLKGVSYMNDDPHEVNVLYGLVHEVESSSPPGRLQKMADDILAHFRSAGYVKREYERDSVKLHMTLINSKESVEDKDDSGKSRSVRKTFDASRILEKYADYDFGEQDLMEMHLSQRFTFNVDGYYQSTCVIACTTAGPV